MGRYIKNGRCFFLTLIILLTLISCVTFGEQIYFKDGAIVEGKIVRDDEGNIYIEVIEQIIRFDKSNIETIDKEVENATPPSGLYAKNMTVDEKFFKEAVWGLEKIYVEYKNGHLSHSIYTEKVQKLQNALRMVADEYPNSQWADDAAFLVANFPVYKKYREILSAYKQIIRKFPDSRFEEWTVENCKVANIDFYASFTIADAAKFELTNCIIGSVPGTDPKSIVAVFEELISKYKKMPQLKNPRPLMRCYIQAIGYYKHIGDMSKAQALSDELAAKYPKDELRKRNSIPLEKISFWLSKGSNETHYNVRAIYLKGERTINKYLGHELYIQTKKGDGRLFRNITYNVKDQGIYGEYMDKGKTGGWTTKRGFIVKGKVENGIFRPVFPEKTRAQILPYAGKTCGFERDCIVIFIPYNDEST
ncbi:MAG: hypothetical protein ABH952_09285 [Candidatus Omnitrophota bacterium]